MRNMIRRIVLFALVFACLLMPMRVLAAESELVTLDWYTDITVIVSYDVSEPRIVLISPSGDRYTSDSQYTLVERARGVVYYHIADAEGGTWRIEYDKGGNTKLDVEVVPWIRPINAVAITVGALEKNSYGELTLNGTLTVEYDGRYNYDLYAVKLDDAGNITTKLLLDESWSTGGETETFNVSLKNVPDGEYHLYAEAYVQLESGAELQSCVQSNAKFTVDGNTATGDESCLTLACDLTENSLQIRFDGVDMEDRLTSAAIVVTQENVEDTLETATFSPDEVFEDSVLFDPADGVLTVQISGQGYSGKFYAWSRTVRPVLPLTIRFDTPEQTNAQNAAIFFDAGAEQFSGAIWRGESRQEVLFNGSGTMQVALEPMEVNELAVTVEQDGVSYRISHRVSVDSIPPSIDLYGVTDSMRTEEQSLLLVGQTESGATLLCNGMQVALDERGGFEVEQTLADGENTIRFEATDAAGNRAIRTVTVTKGVVGAAAETTRQSGGERHTGGIPYVMIGSFAGALLLFGALWFCAMLLRKKQKKTGEKRSPVLPLLAVFFGFASLVCAGLAVWQMMTASRLTDALQGDSLVQLIKNQSVSDTAQQIRTRNAAQNRGWLCVIVAGASLLLCLGFAILPPIIRKQRKKRQSKPRKEKPIKQKPVKPARPMGVAQQTGPAGGAQLTGSFCPDCGAQNKPGSKFCERCGHPLL